MTCPNGHEVAPDSRSCPVCGIAMTFGNPLPQWQTPPAPPPTVANPTVVVQNAPPPLPPGFAAAPGAAPPPTPAPPSDGQNRSIMPWVVLTSIVVLAAAAIVVVALTRGDNDTVETASSDSTIAVSTTAPPVVVETTAIPPVVETTAAPPVTMAPVGSLPAGKFCRDLKAMGYSYTASVEYWSLHGNTNDMDSDRDGIPCATVYPRSDVEAYWIPRIGSMPSAHADISYEVPSGLFCKDLMERGVSVYGAIAYYAEEGYPARMDADGDGVPCETVYADAEEIWYEYGY